MDQPKIRAIPSARSHDRYAGLTQRSWFSRRAPVNLLGRTHNPSLALHGLLKERHQAATGQDYVRHCLGCRHRNGACHVLTPGCLELEHCSGAVALPMLASPAGLVARAPWGAKALTSRSWNWTDNPKIVVI